MMIGLLLVTHGELADALISSAKLIMGETEHIDSVGLYHGDNIDALTDKVIEKIKVLNQSGGSEGVMILTDLFGGSPSNAAARAIHTLKGEVSTECVTGVNLPMLLEAATSRNGKSLIALKDACLEAGRNSAVSLRERYEL